MKINNYATQNPKTYISTTYQIPILIVISMYQKSSI